MSQGIASKNRYDLLGNDPDLDPDREPDPPGKAIEKTLPRTSKRDVPERGGQAGGVSGIRGGRGGSFTGNERAIRDRGAGSFNNRNRPTDDGVRQDRHSNQLKDTEPRGGRGRGGRGGSGRGRGGAPLTDRHSRSGVGDHQKQVAHGWGGQTGGDEWEDEKAGAAIARAEDATGGEEERSWKAEVMPADDPAVTTEPQTDADAASAAAAAEEEKTKSYDAYLAERAERQMTLGPQLTARKANEGSAKKFPEGKQFEREEGADFISGSGGKSKRERQKKEKTLVELDDARMRDAPRENFRGGRGGGRGRGGDGEFRGGGRGRGGGGGGDGEFRGGRGGGGGEGRGEGRGRGGGRGEFRGRGGRGGGGPTSPNVSDTSAFPSLGK